MHTIKLMVYQKQIANTVCYHILLFILIKNNDSGFGAVYFNPA